MTKILIGWELGSNLGHLSRLLPLASRLQARGHKVLAVVRDLALAARLLGPAGIPFVQAPRMSGAPKLVEQPASYADMLRYTGWGDPTQLWGMVQAWVNVIRMFGPEIAILDHSPTALLAARCVRLRCVLIGTGFELPPLQQPLPTFPGFSGATAANAAKAEAEMLEYGNLSLRAARGPLMQSLSDLFQVERRWLTTFAELDHYGPRAGEQYVGSISQVERGERVEWPQGSRRVFAYLRPDTPDLGAILRSLADSEAAVVCHAPGIPKEQTEALSRDRSILMERPIELPPLLAEASLCLSYSPAGTVTTALLYGVPQLLSPAHVEAQLTAHRVECLGAGLVLGNGSSEKRIGTVLQTLLSSPAFKTRAGAFAAKYRGFDPRHAAENIVQDIESLIARAATPVAAGARLGH